MVLEIEAIHVVSALEIARPDLDGFRAEEMGWLEANNTYFKAHVENMFRKGIRLERLEGGEASMLGHLLANRSVRVAIDDDLDEYAKAAQNCVKNLDEDAIRVNAPGAKFGNEWNSREELMRVFGRPQLVEALLEIKHDRSRDAAAFALGCFALETLPDLVASDS